MSEELCFILCEKRWEFDIEIPGAYINFDIDGIDQVNWSQNCVASSRLSLVPPGKPRGL